MTKLYPDSHVEIQGLSARYYDLTLDIATARFYDKFIKSAIAEMNIQPDEHILDIGCGTGRNACLMHEYLGDTGHITGNYLKPSNVNTLSILLNATRIRF